jgi:predicted nuclease with TOPRIM domain
MSCLTSAEKTRLQDRLTRKETQLEALYDAIDKNVLYVESAMLDTGEAQQRMKYRSAEDMYDAATRLERQIDRLYNLLEGTGLVIGRMRRKND